MTSRWVSPIYVFGDYSYPNECHPVVAWAFAVSGDVMQGQWLRMNASYEETAVYVGVVFIQRDKWNRMYSDKQFISRLLISCALELL